MTSSMIFSRILSVYFVLKHIRTDLFKCRTSPFDQALATGATPLFYLRHYPFYRDTVKKICPLHILAYI